MYVCMYVCVDKLIYNNLFNLLSFSYLNSSIQPSTVSR